jgi:hypothetical protein
MANSARIYLLFLFLFAGTLSAHQEATRTEAEAQLEMGIDSRQQKYLRPVFRYDFTLPYGSLFTEVMFYQRGGEALKGAIDFWLNIGYLKKISRRLTGEFRLNHMCRHMASVENPDIFNLNELLARVWHENAGIYLGWGYGIYLGGNQDYTSFLTGSVRLPALFGSEFSVEADVKFRDFQEILYQVELIFSLSKSTDLFVRNSRDYDFENATYIGVRMKSFGRVREYLDSLKLSAGFYPHFEAHKILVEGEFRLMFFKNSSRKLLFTLNFSAPIIRDNGFWGDFYPENMTYVFNLEYEKEILPGWMVLWYSRYYLHLPLDIDRTFDSDLGTGLGIRNQSDFDRLDKALRFDISAGYNFDLDYNVRVNTGFRLLKTNRLDLFVDVKSELSRARFWSSIRLFLNLGQAISIRPFIRFDRNEAFGSDQPVITTFLFGVAMFKWY